ncbi:MAG: hypothetical protein V4591_07135 [Bdellovibrionota bacterium]
MQKLKLFLIGCGFFWIFAWSVFGSLLGAKINLVVASGSDLMWLVGLQKSLLTAAHSHMNSMAISLILFALTISHISSFISKYMIKVVCFGNLISIPIFGFGMLLEAFYPPAAGHFSVFTALVALGAILYMITVMFWASFFILGCIKK